MTPKQDTLSSIHFDTLWRDVQTVLAERSDADWQHHGDSDAGIAMLQALAYGVSDVAYRHMHDLSDILAPAKKDPDVQGFLDITPDDALATAPVTEDDYRRLILDETSDIGETQSRYFPIRNVAVSCHPDGDRLRVLLLPERVTPGLEMTHRRNDTQASLVRRVEMLLSEHRSLGARAPVVSIVGAQPMELLLDVDLQSDEVDLAKAFALLYDLMDNWVSPRVRHSVEGSATEASAATSRHSGERTGHAMSLPPVPFGAKKRRFKKDPRDLVGVVKAVPGIGSIFGIGLAWEVPEADVEEDFALYERDFDGSKNRAICEWRDGRVRWCGITIRTDRAVVPELNAAIINEIVLLRAAPATKARITAHASESFAKWRNLVERVETWKRLPPSFGLHEKSATDKTSQTLWQFLSAFDAQLTAFCERLDKLKNRVQFGNASRPSALASAGEERFIAPGAGASEPREEDLESTVFERGAVQEHLLHYFGVDQSAATRTQLGFFRAETVARNDGFIANVVDIGRDRTVAKGTFAALQKEIAYALGLYSAAFSRDLMTAAPFYMLDISHLIPKALDENAVITVTVAAAPDEQGRLKGTARAGTAVVLARGAIVDVGQAAASSIAFPGVVVQVDVGEEVDTVVVQLSGDRDAWSTSLASLRAGASVTLRSHRSESAYFNLEDVRSEGDKWTANVALNGTFPWMKPNLAVKIHLLADALGNTRQEWESNGTITLVNDGGHSVVQFTSPTKFTAKDQSHRLFMTIPGLYETRSSAGRRLAFVFPQPRQIGHLAFKAWQRVVDQTLARQVPAHLDFEVYWLGDGSFSAFERRYLAWRTPKEGGAASDEGKPGIEAIAVLETLGLARVVQPLKGIGTLHIKRDAEQATSADDALKHWIFHVKSGVGVALATA
jgi:hypothetical protein